MHGGTTYPVPDPMESYEAALRFEHHDLVDFTRRGLAVELWRAQAALASLEIRPGDWRHDHAWSWWWGRHEAVRVALDAKPADR